MQEDSIEQSVARLVGGHLGLPAATISGNARIEDLGADSLDRVELIMTIEERFNITIPQGVAPSIDSIADLVSIVTSALSEQTPPAESNDDS